MKTKRKISAVYLSGPMSGYENFNRPAFDEAAANLRKAGFTVFVPGEHEEYDEAERASRTISKKKREFYMSRDLIWILEMADAVVVLPGWENSEGAKLEVAVAQQVGVPVFEYETSALLGRPVWLCVPGKDD